MKLSALLLVASAAFAQGQRPSFAGSKPIGYPEMAATTEGLGDRFGEVDGTTQRLPIEANGDKALIDRLSKLPIDKQPFWFINWQALEAHRQNPQTYPQKPNTFIDPQLNNVNNVNAGNSNPNGVSVNLGGGGNRNGGSSGNPNLGGSGNPNHGGGGNQNFGNNQNPNLGGSNNQNLDNAIFAAFGNANSNLGGNGNPNIGNNGNPNRGNTGASNFAVPDTSNSGNFDLTNRFSNPSNLNPGTPNFGGNFGNGGGSISVGGKPIRGTNGNSNLGSSFGITNLIPASSNVGNTGNSNRGTVGNSNAGGNSGSAFGNANQVNRNSEPNFGSASIDDRFHGGIELNNFPVEYENVKTNLNSGTVNSKQRDIKTN